jgi:hypothetical protein
MKSISQAFAKEYNALKNRKGRVWADRFKSTLLLDPQSVIDCMLYVDLNPVRAGLVERPEDYEASGFGMRIQGKEEGLLSLGECFNEDSKRLLEKYRGMLYYRGAVATREGQASIPSEVLHAEEQRGFESSGAYLTRKRFFVDGVVLGNREGVREHLNLLREQGAYLRRKHPRDIEDGKTFCLREQRSHFIA